MQCRGSSTHTTAFVHLSKVLIARLKLDKGQSKLPKAELSLNRSEEKGKHEEELGEEGKHDWTSAQCGLTADFHGMWVLWNFACYLSNAFHFPLILAQ